ncbi:Ribokinase [Parasponia andersonii]|uniref:Ribokinase n=1 Tax=Parasponia andersonii TaxID=3476 RepID=A0A2P5D965_PARAD|nr:Ribokinase [Parasponia andersonii]
MKGIAFSPSNQWCPKPLKNPPSTHRAGAFTINRRFGFSNNENPSNKTNPFPCFAINPSRNSNPPAPVPGSPPPPLVVVGSANADIYVEIERLPMEGETISAKTGQTLAGGKGANQAACGGKLSYPTYFVGQVGDDAHGRLITDALENGGVCLDRLSTVAASPTGHAVVMLQSDGQNSIIIVGGANMSCWPETLSDEDLELVRSAGIVLLQREIPDSVNIQVAKAARSAGVPVILDAGGVDAPVPQELLNSVDIFSPNESELSRLTGMPTETFEQISQAVAKCYEMGVKQVLVKLGAKGSALFVQGEEPIKQPVISAEKVLDTTGAGDTFTAAFAVAFVEGKSEKDCLSFAAAAASLCVQVKGAIPSMPDRKSVLNLLQSI